MTREGTRVVLDAISLRDFRNLARLDLGFPGAGAVIVGENGQGKSNLLEAIYYLHLLRSVRGARDVDVVRFGAPGFHISARTSGGVYHELTAGFERACGGTIVTLPAYAQVEPGDIRKLLAALSTADMAIGYRWPRHGNALDRMRRAAFHGLVNFVTGARLRDLGCGVRVMRRQVLEEIDLYGDQHRFLPILAMRLGFRVSEVPARQSAQDRHGRIYRPREYMHHLLDLFSIFFLMRFMCERIAQSGSMIRSKTRSV